MGSIKKLKLNGQDIIPITYEQNILDENGLSLDLKFVQINNNIPTNISQLTNDSGFITNIPIDNLVATNVLNGILNLTDDKYQLTVIESNTTVNLPTVDKYTEISLFFSMTSDVTITMPNVKFQKIPNIVKDKVYEFCFTYVDSNIGWLCGYIEYGDAIIEKVNLWNTLYKSQLYEGEYTETGIKFGISNNYYGWVCVDLSSYIGKIIQFKATAVLSGSEAGVYMRSDANQDLAVTSSIWFIGAVGTYSADETFTITSNTQYMWIEGAGVEFSNIEIYVIENNNNEIILVSNYTPNGSSFVYETDINFANGDYIEASIDLSTCTGYLENVLSVGTTIDTWDTDTCYHMYYTQSTSEMLTCALIPYQNSDTSNTYSGTILVKIDKDGIYINGTEVPFSNTTVYEAVKTALLSATYIKIGSQEGDNRSNATYNYIKVVKGNN